ncbi:MAG: TIGR00730 family Rossman fold protein [Odoribacter sp.]|nr:TIGR00730 family Rossman fold protein [Odoribacter sp.]
MKLAVFCASAKQLEREYFEVAEEVGKLIGEVGGELIYGGTNLGLMKVVADATIKHGGRVTGIIPTCIADRGVAAEGLERLIVVADMKERKALMREEADGFVALPGGWGTLEEIIETITLKQLGEHRKPIIFLNIAGFYDGFLKFIEEITKKGFVSSVYQDLYVVLQRVNEIMPYLEQYKEKEIVAKYRDNTFKV